MTEDDDNEEDPFDFPIQETDINVHMKNVPPSVLPNFKHMRLEDPETFLFEFEIICRSYCYSLLRIATRNAKNSIQNISILICP